MFFKILDLYLISGSPWPVATVELNNQNIKNAPAPMQNAPM